MIITECTPRRNRQGLPNRLTPTLQELARAVDGKIDGHRVRFGPPGHSRADRSAWVEIAPHLPGGFYVGTFASADDWLVIKDFVFERLGTSWRGTNFLTRPRRQFRQLDQADHVDHTERALAIWDEAHDPRGTLVERYLEDERKLLLPDELCLDVIRYHPACPFRDDRAPAMLAVLHDINTDQPVAIQRTRLSLKGEKIERRSLAPERGAAIKVDDNAHVTIALAIGEGFETCLTARQRGLPWPVWAMGGAGKIGKLPVLPTVQTLILLAENNHASRQAVAACKARWEAAGREVIILDPKVGDDLNDAHRAVGGHHE